MVEIFKRLLCFMTLILVSTSYAELQLNDVAILYPIPEVRFQDYFMGIESQGLAGPLLTRDQFDFISRHLDDLDLKSDFFEDYRHWKVVSIRLDPCAVREKSPCRPEIRLVAQAYSREQFRNRTLHLTYELANSSWNRFVEKNRELNRKSGIRHPEFISPHSGFDKSKRSNFQSKYETLLLETIGQLNLFRVGIMLSENDFWSFAGFQAHRENGGQIVSLIPEDIPHAKGRQGQIFEGTGFSLSPVADSSFEITPMTPLASQVGRIISNKQLRASFEAAVKHESERKPDEKILLESNLKSHRLAVGIVNDVQKYSRFNTDCLSCHLASQALKYSQSVFVNNFSGRYPYPKTQFPIRFGAERLAQSFISFGYVNYDIQRISLSDRVRTEAHLSLIQLRDQVRTTNTDE